MSRASNDLEKYPLAVAYKWRPANEDTGGIMYLYPPIRATSTRERIYVMDLDSALHPSIKAEVDEEYRINRNISKNRERGTAQRLETINMRKGGRVYSVPSVTEMKRMSFDKLVAVARKMKWNVEPRGKDIRVIGRGQMSRKQFRKWLASEARAVRSRERVGEEI